MNGKHRRGRIFALLMALSLCIGTMTVTAQAEEYQYGHLNYYSKISKTSVGDSFWFSDEWLLRDGAERNDALALLSAQLACTAKDGASSEAMLEALGFENVHSERYGSTDPGDCAYTLGTKKLNGRTVVAVVFQGLEYGDKGWQQNVTVDPGGTVTPDQGSYAAAAETFLSDFDKLKVPSGSILWISGLSRAGAVANLACAFLIDRKPGRRTKRNTGASTTISVRTIRCRCCPSGE